MAVISGQKTVDAAGTEVALGTQSINGPVMIKALPTNTGNVYIGNAGDGTVGSSSGLVLGPRRRLYLRMGGAPIGDHGRLSGQR